MKYEIIRRETADELILAVNSYINNGWQPTSGLEHSCLSAAR
jgi:hypothetical protein